MISAGNAVVKLRKAQADLLRVVIACNKCSIDTRGLEGAILALSFAIQLIREDITP